MPSDIGQVIVIIIIIIIIIIIPGDVGQVVEVDAVAVHPDEEGEDDLHLPKFDHFVAL